MRNEKVLAEVALKSLHEDVAFLKKKRAKENRILAETWKRQQEVLARRADSSPFKV